MTNKALFLTGIEKLEFLDVEVPKIEPCEVLVKMEAVGVCGSDLHYYSHGRIGDYIVEFPFVLGHECSGTIVEVGNKVTHLKVGDRVTLEPGVPCGNCELCFTGRYNLCSDVRFFATPPYHGCLMNYVSHPARFTFKLPDKVSTIEGALTEPLAIGINAALTGNVKLGDTVLIFGAGCIGLVSLLASKAYGATKIIVVDIIDKRLDVAKSMGALTLNAKKCDVLSEISNLTNGLGAQVVIDCAGTNATICQTVKAAKAGGNIILVGLASDAIDGLSIGHIIAKELVIKSIFRYKNLYPVALTALADGKIDISGILSNKYKFEDAPRAFSETQKNAQNIVKSVIIFD